MGSAPDGPVPLSTRSKRGRNPWVDVDGVHKNSHTKQSVRVLVCLNKPKQVSVGDEAACLKPTASPHISSFCELVFEPLSSCQQKDPLLLTH